MIAAAVLAGCTAEEYDRTDLQLDVDAPLPSDAATLHLCVSGTGTLDVGAGNGRASFTGILAGDPVTVTVDALDAEGGRIGRASAVLDAAAPWALAPWSTESGAPCEDPGRRAPDTAETWLLGVRFAEAAWS